MTTTNPPYYVLLRPGPNTLIHPHLQYFYADDNPQAALPRPGEQVYLLDYDPPTAQSISPAAAVSSVKVEEAPAASASAAEDGEPDRNDRMYIIETIPTQERILDGSIGERKPASALLTQFKQRYEIYNLASPLNPSSNAVLRRALLYPASET
ncbi:hypothetical protein MKEN_00775800 [Mycena kentingensis (nom. inval.)]|nr:hypothetical protein MKEN_00775800 [Mycena kentingensis (nom. inval.)]